MLRTLQMPLVLQYVNRNGEIVRATFCALTMLTLGLLNKDTSVQ